MSNTRPRNEADIMSDETNITISATSRVIASGEGEPLIPDMSNGSGDRLSSFELQFWRYAGYIPEGGPKCAPPKPDTTLQVWFDNEGQARMWAMGYACATGMQHFEVRHVATIKLGDVEIMHTANPVNHDQA